MKPTSESFQVHTIFVDTSGEAEPEVWLYDMQGSKEFDVFPGALVMRLKNTTMQLGVILGCDWIDVKGSRTLVSKWQFQVMWS